MNELLHVVITVFCKELDNPTTLEESLRALVPFTLEDQKLAIEKQSATGVEGNPIGVWKITLEKKSHANQFMKHLLEQLSMDNKRLIAAQADSRVDEDYHFFLRFDKETWIKKRTLALVDHGSCFHFNFTLACYPKNRTVALAIVQKLFDSSAQRS